MPKGSELPAVGGNVRRERQARHLSLEELAARSGVSKAMLSQVESGKANPTIATMWKIAQALNVDFNILLKGAGGEVRKFQVCRREDLTSLDADDDGVHISVLSPPSQVEDLELYLVTLQPGAALSSPAHYAGTEEFLTVLTGEVRVEAGKNRSQLHPGDVIIYQCDVDHRLTNIGDEPCRVHMVVRFQPPRG